RASDDLAGDPVHAEADDFSGTNNANMFTPADGASPRMQMYIFSGPSDIRLVINSPAAIAQTLRPGTAAFGAQGFDLTADVALADDGTPPTSDGCQAINPPAAPVRMPSFDPATPPSCCKSANAQPPRA